MTDKPHDIHFLHLCLKLPEPRVDLLGGRRVEQPRSVTSPQDWIHFRIADGLAFGMVRTVTGKMKPINNESHPIQEVGTMLFSYVTS